MGRTKQRRKREKGETLLLRGQERKKGNGRVLLADPKSSFNLVKANSSPFNKSMALRFVQMYLNGSRFPHLLEELNWLKSIS